MAFNKNEVVLERIKQASFYDFDGKLLNRLTSIEDPSLNTTAEKEEVLNAQGNTITEIYRAKKATFSGSNSLFSFDLTASQFGVKKEVAGTEGVDPETVNYTPVDKIINYASDTKTIAKGQVELSHVPVANSIKYIYIIENGEIGQSYPVNISAASDTEAFVNGKTITVPTSITEGKVYVEYPYESTEAIRVVNNANQYPAAGKLVILALFRDKCTDQTILGSIICPKAKLNPESVDLALTPTGKHPFEYTMMMDMCSDEDELFEIVLSN